MTLPALMLSAPLALAPSLCMPDAAEMQQHPIIMASLVVTAYRRREETLIDVPNCCIGVLGEKLPEGAVDITALQQQTPNLYCQIARGSELDADASIRGVGQRDPLWV